jgi:hypothetical protein
VPSRARSLPREELLGYSVFDSVRLSDRPLIPGCSLGCSLLALAGFAIRFGFLRRLLDSTLLRALGSRPVSV